MSGAPGRSFVLGIGIVGSREHDRHGPQQTPLGILDVMADWLTVIFGSSRETSDVIVDCRKHWWHDNQERSGHIRQLVINLDNGLELHTRRTRFTARMIAFAEQTGLEVVLVCDPPYRSKYNPIERCWGTLEMHWKGALLDSMATISPAGTASNRGRV